MKRLLLAVFAPAAAYQILATVAAIRFRNRARKIGAPTFQPPVSVLKPIRGIDSGTFEAFVSQAAQRYPRFEILFGVRDGDPAIVEIERLQGRFPDVNMRMIRSTTDARNGKVGVLIDLSKHARYPIWVVNDADIKVGPNYLKAIAAPLANPEIGVVTCPYVASARSAATRWEAFGIATDFMPSVLVAHLLGVRDFALGATLAFRAADWQAAGGFESIRDHLADDYQVGNRLAQLGKRSHLCTYVVETSLGAGSWRDVWNHQLRWARTIRFSKPSSYSTLPVTHAGLWALVALSFGLWPLAAGIYFVRCVSAAAAQIALRGGVDERTGRLAGRCARFYVAPLWDLYAFAVWAASYLGSEVRWRDRVLRLGSNGIIVG